MSERMPIVPRLPAVCPRCGQATFHLRGICRTCDPCTATLLAAADAALAAEQTPALAGMVAAHPDECVPTHELAG
jgi:Fe-S cluster biogenesis protein NfuA